MDEFYRMVSKMIEPVRRELSLMLARCVLDLVNSDGKMQMLQVELLDGEPRDKVEHFESYGYTSRPHPGAEGLFAAVAGNRDHGIAVCVGNREFRIKSLQTGEVAMYTDEGDVIKMARGRNINVVCGTKVTFTCPNVEMTGNLKVGGNVVADGDVSDAGGTKSMAGMRAVYNDHDHTENDNGGPTDPPNQDM